MGIVVCQDETSLQSNFTKTQERAQVSLRHWHRSLSLTLRKFSIDALQERRSLPRALCWQIPPCRSPDIRRRAGSRNPFRREGMQRAEEAAKGDRGDA